MFRVDTDATPIFDDGASLIFALDYFRVDIADDSFVTADGTADLNVGAIGVMQFSAHLNRDIPLPGYWIEQIVFQVSDDRIDPNNVSIPTSLQSSMPAVFDMDLHVPGDYSYVWIF